MAKKKQGDGSVFQRKDGRWEGRIVVGYKENALNEWVFYNPCNPNLPMNPASAYQKLHTILNNAELPRIRFHDLRHTFATHATKGGVDPKTLSGILGHTNASFTLDTYTHVTGDMQKNAAAIVGGMVKKLKLEDE